MREREGWEDEGVGGGQPHHSRIEAPEVKGVEPRLLKDCSRERGGEEMTYYTLL